MREFGLLGQPEASLPFGFQLLFNSLVKEIDKQFQKLDQEGAEEKKQMPVREGINIHITSMGNRPFIEVQHPVKEIKKIKVTDDMVKKLSTLPKKEAQASVRRFSNKIVYELELPGVRSLQDIIVSKLESSVEIKAIAQDKVFFKLIPVQMPILGYQLYEGKLILEFKA